MAMPNSQHVCRLRGHKSAIMNWIKVLFSSCISRLRSTFQIPASNTVGGVAETRTVIQYVMVKISMLFCGIQFSDNDLNQNSVSFVHMFNACLNCIASFRSLHQIL